jgi:transcriptional regulator with XRE-family HTH domain
VRGVSLRQMERMNPLLSRDRISRIERGERPLSVATLAAIAEVLELKDLARTLAPFCNPKDRDVPA